MKSCGFTVKRQNSSFSVFVNPSKETSAALGLGMPTQTYFGRTAKLKTRVPGNILLDSPLNQLYYSLLSSIIKHSCSQLLHFFLLENLRQEDGISLLL